MAKKKYFPNNVDALLEAPAELFKQIEFEEFMDWKVCGWDLPDSVECIIRSHNTRTNKVKEWIYERPLMLGSVFLNSKRTWIMTSLLLPMMRSFTLLLLIIDANT